MLSVQLTRTPLLLNPQVFQPLFLQRLRSRVAAWSAINTTNSSIITRIESVVIEGESVVINFRKTKDLEISTNRFTEIDYPPYAERLSFTEDKKLSEELPGESINQLRDAIKQAFRDALKAFS